MGRFSCLLYLYITEHATRRKRSLNANLPPFGPEATRRGQASGYVMTNSLPAESLVRRRRFRNRGLMGVAEDVKCPGNTDFSGVRARMTVGRAFSKGGKGPELRERVGIPGTAGADRLGADERGHSHGMDSA